MLLDIERAKVTEETWVCFWDLSTNRNFEKLKELFMLFENGWIRYYGNGEFFIYWVGHFPKTFTCK